VKIIKRDFMVVFLIAVLISALTATIAPASHAAEKVGSKCSVFGKTVVKGKTKLTCVKVTEYKWVAAPIKPALASIYNPVLPGNKFKLNTLQFQAGPVNFDFGDEVCRENAFNDFKRGNSRVLISSNVTARGIDIQQVSIVINFDLPKDVNTYLHRIGRSGRWGRKGIGINFISRRDVTKMKEIENYYSTQITEMPSEISFLSTA